MEADIVKKRQRTLPGSRCQVRVHEENAPRISNCCIVPRLGRVAQRLSCLAQQQASAECAGGRAPESGHQGGAHAEPQRQFAPHFNRDLPAADNLLNQAFAPSRPNEAWVTDITYVHTDEGWLYVAGIKDVFPCELAGYAMRADAQGAIQEYIESFSSKASITVSGVTHAWAMCRPQCLLKISAGSRRRLETRVSAIDRTPHFRVWWALHDRLCGDEKSWQSGNAPHNPGLRMAGQGRGICSLRAAPQLMLHFNDQAAPASFVH